MTGFEKKFFNVLLEDDRMERAERKAFEASLDRDTDAGEFDVDVAPESKPNTDDAAMDAARAGAEYAVKMRQQLEEWIDRMDEFKELLNSQEPNSIQSVLAGAEADTIFDRIKHAEQRKIARVAIEVASLLESFKGYLAQADNPQFRFR